MNVNYIDKNGKTSLQEACNRRHLHMIKLLLSFGADVNYIGRDGKTSLQEACLNGDMHMVHILLSYGANVYDKNKAGYTPFQNLIKYWSPDAIPKVKLCLLHGAYIYDSCGDGSIRVASPSLDLNRELVLTWPFTMLLYCCKAAEVLAYRCRGDDRGDDLLYDSKPYDRVIYRE